MQTYLNCHNVLDGALTFYKTPHPADSKTGRNNNGENVQLYHMTLDMILFATEVKILALD